MQLPAVRLPAGAGAVVAKGRDWVSHHLAWIVLPLLAYVIYHAARTQDLYVFLLLAAIMAGIFAVVQYELSMLIVIALIGLGYSQLIPVGFGGFNTDGMEALAFLATFSVLIGKLARRNTGRTPGYAPAVALLMLATALGAVTVLAHGADFQDVPGRVKNLMWWLVGFAIAIVFSTSEKRDRLETWIIRSAAIGCFLIVVSKATGLEVSGSVQSSVATNNSSYDAERIRNASQVIGILALLLLIARMKTRPATRNELVALGVIVLGEVLGLTRSVWLPVTAACLLLAVLGRGVQIPLRGVRIAITTVVMVGLLITASAGGALGNEGTAAWKRLQSALTPNALNDPSYLVRKIENLDARGTLQGDELFGVGLAQPYGQTVLSYDEFTKSTTRSNKTYIHNSYYSAWLQTGLLGLLAFVALKLYGALAIARSRRISDNRELNRVLAGGLTVVVMGVGAFFANGFDSRPEQLVTMLGLAFAAPALLRRRDVEPPVSRPATSS